MQHVYNTLFQKKKPKQNDDNKEDKDYKIKDSSSKNMNKIEDMEKREKEIERDDETKEEKVVEQNAEDQQA